MAGRIAVIDDCYEDALRIRTLIEHTGINCDISVFSCVEEFVSVEECFDLLFLDIDLGEKDGILESRKLKTKTRWIVYITSLKERMKDAFAFNVVGYLLKADSNEHLQEEIAGILKEYVCASIHVRTDTGYLDIPVSDIYVIARENRKLILYLHHTEIRIYDLTLSGIRELVGDDFLMTDRSVLVNCRHITDIRKDIIRLDNGRSERISARRVQTVTAEYMNRILSFRH